MLNYNTKEEAQKARIEIEIKNDWESNTLTVAKAFKPLNGVDGWIILDGWNQPI
jgi:hypothetical protein